MSFDAIPFSLSFFRTPSFTLAKSDSPPPSLFPFQSSLFLIHSLSPLPLPFLSLSIPFLPLPVLLPLPLPFPYIVLRIETLKT